MLINNSATPITVSSEPDDQKSMQSKNHTPPVVGVLTTPITRPNKKYPQGKKARLFRELIHCGKQKGIFIYFFANEKVDWKGRVIKGYTFKNKQWVSNTYPFPDIVYNRILDREFEEKKSIKLLLKRFENDKNIYLFNSRFLDKWEVHKVLNSYWEGQQLIPETVLFNRRNLRDFTLKYKEIFLKPRDGYRGKGVIKIKCPAQNNYQYASAGLSKVKWRKSSSFDLLYRHISKLIANEKSYLLQQAIELAKYNGRVFDLRVQVQKNGQGIWIMTGAAARVAEKGRFVTHISNGGKAESYENVINKFSGNCEKVKSELNEQLRNISTIIPRLLEKELDITLGILTLDIGLDKDGKLWVIEVNSKPGSFDEDNIRKQHLSNLINFFIYAAGRNN